MKGGDSKYILKQAVRGLLPQEIIDRPKEGFLMPMNFWILKYFDRFFQSTLADDQLNKHGLLRAGAIRNLLDEHRSGKRNNGDRLWNILMFQLWWNRYQT
jgi:asparagine synthase (glutamine-hydrolysing)